MIGRSVDSDLVLEHPSVSRQHARVERAEDGRLFVQDKHSRNGTFLFRSEQWIRVQRVSLCREDILRLGDQEVRPGQLASLYGAENRVWLPAVPQPSFAAGDERNETGKPGDGRTKIRKPRRNPVTGQIEENLP